MSSISIGHTLSGRYEVKSVIGQGGFGITYEAEHMLLKSKVCIKELYISGLNTRTLDETLSVDFHQKDSYQKSIRRFIEEAQKLQQFSHPNIVQVSDLFEDNNTAYMVMELIEGENLKQYVKRKGVLLQLSTTFLETKLLPIFLVIIIIIFLNNLFQRNHDMTTQATQFSHTIHLFMCPCFDIHTSLGGTQ